MPSFAIVGVVAGIYSALATAIFFSLRKENSRGPKRFWELIKWLMWAGVAIFLPLLAMQDVDAILQMELNRSERSYVLFIWLGFLWSYISFAAYRSWKKGKLKIFGADGKLLYEGRKGKDIS